MFFIDFNYSKNKGINFVRLPVSNQTQIEATFVYLATLYKDNKTSFFKAGEDVLDKDAHVPMEEIQTRLVIEEMQKQQSFPDSFKEEDIRCAVALKKILDIVWKLQQHVITKLYAVEGIPKYFLNDQHQKAFKMKIKELSPREFGTWMMSELYQFIPGKRVA